MLGEPSVGVEVGCAGLPCPYAEMAMLIAGIMDKPLKMKEEYPYASRPGWDFSYRISGELLHELGWEPTENFMALLRQTVESYAKT